MISVKKISKTFKLYQTPAHRLKELIIRRTFHSEFKALHDVSFTIAEGETLGIIGANGSGKSTLLKLLTGVLMPDSGHLQVDGKITGLLELGTGFNTEFSGTQNIYHNGTYLGLSRHQIGERLDQIVELAELKNCILDPVKTYSSGMIMRLAFSIAIHAEPQAFVIDEALSVGDAYFQQKCMRKIREFKDNGGSIVFVSHDMNAIKVLCDKAILLENGSVVEQGSPEKVVNTYNFLVTSRSLGRHLTGQESSTIDIYGNQKVTIDDVRLINEYNEQAKIFEAGRPLTIEIEITAHTAVPDITLGILFRDRFGQDIYGTNSWEQQFPIQLTRRQTCCLRYSFKALNIGCGKYSLTLAAHTDKEHTEECFEWINKYSSFEVVAGKNNYFIGLCRLQPILSLQHRSSQSPAVRKKQ